MFSGFIQRPVLWASAGLALFILLAHTPLRFISGTLISIPQGASFGTVAETLEEKNIITSSTLLRACMVLFGGAEHVKAGDYLFLQPQGSCAIARRLSKGEYALTSIRVTFPEGTSIAGMARILVAELPAFDGEEFKSIASTSEGYLFPDTYFFLPNTTPESVLSDLRQTFNDKTTNLLPAIALSDRTIEDIVTMASLLEEEARTLEDKRIVAGILWKRIDEGMALQVDAPFIYILGKSSHELTGADLEFDSPYNTYLYRGLPPTSISNPGLESMMAALTPTDTAYWFYLSDSEGTMHYAETFEGHKANKEKHFE
ncbi:MAG: endolytic transglycosylase MltG [Patescibacteria group bacterium]